MGLLTCLIALPLAPVRGVTWVAERLDEAAERELYDPAVIRARLAALNQALENGDLDMEQFEREEERLLDLLEGHGAGAPAWGAAAHPGTGGETGCPVGDSGKDAR